MAPPLPKLLTQHPDQHGSTPPVVHNPGHLETGPVVLPVHNVLQEDEARDVTKHEAGDTKVHLGG